MKDRIPTKPGRMKLTDEVTGVVSYVIAEMADEPVETGTDLNMANLLTDATAALLAKFGNTPDTVNEALASLSNAVGVESFSYVGTGTYGSEANATELTFTHKPRLFVITQVSGSAPMWVNYGKDQGVFSWDALEDAWNSRGAYTYASIVYPTPDQYHYEIKFTISDNTIKFWNAQSDAYQYNSSTSYRVISFY